MWLKCGLNIVEILILLLYLFAVHEHTFHLREKSCLTYKYPLPALLKADKFPTFENYNTTYKLR